MLWYCLDCSTSYAPGIQACPQCGSIRRGGIPAGPPISEEEEARYRPVVLDPGVVDPPEVPQAPADEPATKRKTAR